MHLYRKQDVATKEIFAVRHVFQNDITLTGETGTVKALSGAAIFSNVLELKLVKPILDLAATLGICIFFYEPKETHSPLSVVVEKNSALDKTTPSPWNEQGTQTCGTVRVIAVCRLKARGGEEQAKRCGEASFVQLIKRTSNDDVNLPDYRVDNGSAFAPDYPQAGDKGSVAVPRSVVVTLEDIGDYDKIWLFTDYPHTSQRLGAGTAAARRVMSDKFITCVICDGAILATYEWDQTLKYEKAADAGKFDCSIVSSSKPSAMEGDVSRIYGASIDKYFSGQKRGAGQTQKERDDQVENGRKEAGLK